MFKKLYVAPAYRQASLRSFNVFFCLTATNMSPLCGSDRFMWFVGQAGVGAIEKHIDVVIF
ncbi:MAG: hypothetical protein ACYC49_17240 [Ignavibacteriaceae bacterium]